MRMRRAGCVIGALLAVLGSAPLGAQQGAGTIRGHVSDAATHQPLVGATISVGTRRALSQSDGRYLITGVPVGSDSLRARVIGYARAGQLLTIAAGDSLVVGLALTAQAASWAESGVSGDRAARGGNLTRPPDPGNT